MLAALAAARFAHNAALCLFFGLAVFPPCMAGAGGARPVVRRGLLTACAAAVLVTGGLELLATAAAMGDAWSAAIDPATVAAAGTDTRFGQVWAWRLALAAVTVALCLARYTRRDVVVAVAAGLLLASVALTGHSAIPGGWVGRWHQAADAVHLLAAGWWVGGLLALLLAAAGPASVPAAQLARFSRFGYSAVALLVLSGVAKSLILVAPLSALVTTAYGRVLLAKLALFGAMGLLALSNRVQVTPGLARGADPRRWRRRLAWQVGTEFGLGLAVLAVVGVLGALPPPG